MSDEVELDLSIEVPMTVKYVSADVLAKAARLVREEAITPESVSAWLRQYRVQGDTGTYLVNLGLTEKDGGSWWITCSCKFGQQNMVGRPGCSHAVAVLILLDAEKP